MTTREQEVMAQNVVVEHRMASNREDHERARIESQKMLTEALVSNAELRATASEHEERMTSWTTQSRLEHGAGMPDMLLGKTQYPRRTAQRAQFISIDRDESRASPSRNGPSVVEQRGESVRN